MILYALIASIISMMIFTWLNVSINFSLRADYLLTFCFKAIEKGIQGEKSSYSSKDIYYSLSFSCSFFSNDFTLLCFLSLILFLDDSSNLT